MLRWWIGKADEKKADPVNKVMIRDLKDQPLKSITPDRGKEFSKHSEVTASPDDVQFYFPRPHHLLAKRHGRKYKWPSQRILSERERFDGYYGRLHTEQN